MQISLSHALQHNTDACKGWLYADHTHCFANNSIENIDLNLNEDLARVNKWLTANKLTINTSKTEFMIMLIGFQAKVEYASEFSVTHHWRRTYKTGKFYKISR